MVWVMQHRVSGLARCSQVHLTASYTVTILSCTVQTPRRCYPCVAPVNKDLQPERPFMHSLGSLVQVFFTYSCMRIRRSSLVMRMHMQKEWKGKSSSGLDI